MPGILKEDKEEVVIGEETNGKLRICEKMNGDTRSKEEVLECDEENVPHHVVNANGSPTNGEAGEEGTANGRTSRDSSTSDYGECTEQCK